MHTDKNVRVSDKIAPVSWNAPVLWRSGIAGAPWKSGRRLPQSKALR
jgi:hypothetical protein